MNWLEIIQKTLDDVEDKLSKNISIQHYANENHVSYYHFNKIFSAICGVSLSEYIKSRRLSIAATRLTNEDTSVIEIAFDSQFSTPESFTKSFKRFHGVTPTQARGNGVPLVHFPRLSLQFIKEGEDTMKYLIEDEEVLYFLGKSATFTKNGNMIRDVAKELWKKTMSNGGFDLLKPYTNIKRPCGVVFDINPESESASYLVGVQTPTRIDIEGYELIEIPKSKFVKLQCEANSINQLHKMKKELFTNWVSDNGFEFYPVAEIEFYQEEGNPDKSKFEYWISIK